MKTPVAFTLSCILMLGSASAALAVNTANADSTITEATVYPDRALVTRSAQVELSAGITELTFSKLPVALIDQSVQVSARGTSSTLLDVSTRIVHTTEVANPRIAELETELEGLNKQQALLLTQNNLLSRQLEIVTSIENTTTGAVVSASNNASTLPAQFTWQERNEILNFSSTQRNNLAKEQLANADQRQELSKKISAVTAQLRELQRSPQTASRSNKVVTIRLEAEAPGTLDVKLSYMLPGARWTPLYDTRLLLDTREVSLSYFGTVYNNTGENWKDVALTLSTARPSLGGVAPEAYPKYIDIMSNVTTRRGLAYEAEEEVITLETFSVRSEKSRAGAKMAASPPPPARQAVAQVDSSSTSASFKVVTPANIPADNSPQKISITSTNLPAKISYQATPYMMETAFLSANLTNNTDYPLLAGRTNIFIGPSFIASSNLKTIMPGEKFDIALGADEGIAIKRKLVNRYTEEVGMITKSTRVTHDILFTITNNKKTAEELTFKEPLPISRNEQIIVKLLGPAEKDVGTKEKPGREVSREDDNIMVWRIKLAPGEKREIPFKYSVEYPIKSQVIGLD